MKRSHQLLPLLAATTLVACDGLPTGGSDGITVDRIENFAPGETAVLVGANLDRINSLTLEGQSVTLSAGTATERSFTAPQLRACETDGRKVEAVVNGGTKLSAPLQVAGVLRMEVGESRVLGADASCLQLPAADQDFVITALNPSLAIVTPAVAAPLAELRTWTESAAAPSNTRLSVSRASAWTRDAHLEAEQAARASLLANGDGYYSDNPVPFDPNYATAQVGDIVRFVNWKGAGGDFCFRPRSETPTYQVQVVAVSDNLVIGVDLRLPNAQALLQQSTAIQSAAAIAGPLLLPAIREIIDPQFEGLKGGGGRLYAIIGELPSDAAGVSADGATSTRQGSCPLASEMITVVLAHHRPYTAASAGDVASTIIHEYAHNADNITGLRRHGPFVPFTSAIGWAIEAVAVNAQEAAARIAIKRSTDAPHWQLPATSPSTGTLFSDLWGEAPEQSPWSESLGNYDLRASLYLYLRERAGDTDIGDARTPIYLTASERLAGRMWTFDRFAQLLDTDPVTLLDEWSLAHATDDLVESAKADARKLPRFRTWDNRGRGGIPLSQRSVSRSSNQRVTLSAGNGNYATAYFLAEGMQGSQARRGISVQVTPQSNTPSLLRITRLR